MKILLIFSILLCTAEAACSMNKNYKKTRLQKKLAGINRQLAIQVSLIPNATAQKNEESSNIPLIADIYYEERAIETIITEHTQMFINKKITILQELDSLENSMSD